MGRWRGTRGVTEGRRRATLTAGGRRRTIDPVSRNRGGLRRQGAGVHRLRVMMAGLCALATVGVASAAADPGADLGRRIAWEVDGRLAITNGVGGVSGTHHTAIDGTWPRWSPDGETIVFRRNAGQYPGYFGAGGDVHLIGADGEDPELLLATGTSHGPATWSPDGRRLTVADGRNVVVVDVATRRVTLRTAPPAGVRHHSPVWSPLGHEVAFIESEPGSPSRLLAVAADGSGTARTVVAEPVDGVAAIAWSPDARTLALLRAGELWRVDPDGGNLVRLTDLAAHERYAQDLAFAPDARSIALSVNGPGRPDEPPYPAVWIVDLVGGGARQLATPPESSAHDLTWTPDGRHIVVTAGYDDSGDDRWHGELYAVSPDGSMRNLTSTFPDSDQRADVAPGVARRAAGPSRIETAVAAARHVFDTAPVVVLARSDDYPDALAGAPLAARLGGPLLLTTRERLHPAAAEEIRRLGAGEVVLLGSEVALHEQVARDLEHTGIRVRRIGGADRFDTARRIGELGGTRAYVVEGAHPDPGRGWPDAVAVSTLAAHEGAAILLVTREVLPDATDAALRDGELAEAVIIGSTAAVGREVEADVRAAVAWVERVAGATRYETSAAIAERTRQRLDADAPVWLATGGGWPDALAAGPAAAAGGGILLLVDGRDLAGSPPGADWLGRNLADRALLVGGPSALSPLVRTQLERLAADR
jgi:Tol biopolymer transport system component